MSKAVKPKVKTLSDYRSEFDVDVKIPAKIAAALVSLASEGPEAWEYEVDFIKRAGTSNTYFAKYRDQFSSHFVFIPSSRGTRRVRAWFGDKKVAAKARG